MTINKMTPTDTPNANPSETPPLVLTNIVLTFPLITLPFDVTSMYTYKWVTTYDDLSNY